MLYLAWFGALVTQLILFMGVVWWQVRFWAWLELRSWWWGRWIVFDAWAGWLVSWIGRGLGGAEVEGTPSFSWSWSSSFASGYSWVGTWQSWVDSLSYSLLFFEQLGWTSSSWGWDQSLRSSTGHLSKVDLNSLLFHLLQVGPDPRFCSSGCCCCWTSWMTCGLTLRSVHGL